MVEVWDTDKRELVRCLNAPVMKRPAPNWEYPARLTPDGSEAWLRLPNGDLARWDVETGRELPRLVAGSDPVPDCLFPLPDGRTLLAPCGSWVRIFDRATGKERPVPGRYKWNTIFAVSPDDRHVAVGDPNGRLDLLDAGTGKLVRTVRERGDQIDEIAFGPDGAVLAIGDSRRLRESDPNSLRTAMRAFSVPEGTTLWERPSTSEKENARFVSLLGGTPEGRALSFFSEFRVWDFKTGKELRRFAAAVGGYPTADPARKVLATEDYGEVILFDLGTGRELKRMGSIPSNGSGGGGPGSDGSRGRRTGAPSLPRSPRTTCAFSTRSRARSAPSSPCTGGRSRTRSGATSGTTERTPSNR